MLIIMLIAGFFVVGPHGEPVQGAWVGFEDHWLSATDREGYAELLEPTDTVTVRASGFLTWTGPAPSQGDSLKLQATTVGPGTTIHVLASRGSLEGRLPSTVVLTGKSLETLGKMGMERLQSMVPGVTVREYGGAMGVLSVSLRGGEAGQSDLMVDGVSISSVRDGMPTAVLDPSIFESVEVARGGGSAGTFGTGSAGAVNFMPPSGNAPFTVSASCFSSGALSTTTRFGRTGISLARTAGASGSQGVASSLVSSFSSGSLSGGVLASIAAGETDDPQWTLEGDGERENRSLQGWVNWTGSTLETDLSLGTGYMKYLQTEPYTVEDSHTDLSARISCSLRTFVLLSGTLSCSSVNSTATGRHTLCPASLNASSSYGKLRFDLGAVVDARGWHPSGRITVTHMPDGISASLHASAFTDFRAPTVNDLYWPYDGTTSGNPDLASERSIGGEAGISWHPGMFYASVCGFLTSTDDLIIWLPDDDGTWRPSNVSSVLSKGLEVACGAGTEGIEADITVTWNIAEDRTEDTPRYGMLLPYRPEYTFGGQVSFPIPEGFDFSAGFTGTGKRFTNRTQSEYLEEYFIVDVSAGKFINSNLRVEVTAGNLFDREYETGNGFPGMGRNLGISLEYRGN